MTTKIEFLRQTSELPMVRDVSCDRCGACCMHMGYPPFIGMFNYDLGEGDPEWLALPKELASEARQGAIDNRGDLELPCIWLDPLTRKCRHYDQRPEICRSFEMGSPECMDARERRGIV